MRIKNFNYDLVKYVVPSYKLNKEVRVILLADLHGYTNDRKKSLLLAEEIKKLKPHHIIIAGDIMQGDEWENEILIKNLRYFFDNLQEECPLFVELGNHDDKGNNENNSKRRIANFKIFRYGKIYPIFNNKITYDDFQIVGFTPSIKLSNNSFFMSNELLQKQFIEEVNENMVIDNDDKHHIEFICHDPHMIMGNDLGVLKNCDTFYSGHLHNGYIRSWKTRKYPDRYLDYGYTEKLYEIDLNGKLIKVNPLLISKTDLCRGCIFFNDDAKYLELRNGHYYKMIDNKWYPIYSNEAIKVIVDNILKSMVVTGGVKKFSHFSELLDIPEITMVTYEGKEKILTK